MKASYLSYMLSLLMHETGFSFSPFSTSNLRDCFVWHLSLVDKKNIPIVSLPLEEIEPGHAHAHTHQPFNARFYAAMYCLKERKKKVPSSMDLSLNCRS